MPLRNPRTTTVRSVNGPTLLRPLALALALALGLGASLNAQAQNLQALYDASRGYDATYLAARAAFEASKYRVEQAYAKRRPNVGLAVNGNYNGSETPDASPQRSATSKTADVTITASQTLFNRTNDLTITQAEISLDAARADLESIEQDLIVRLSQAYFDVLTAQDALATARGSLTAIAEQLASAKRNFEVGTASITDTREAQARHDLARAQEILASNDLLTKRIALNQLVGNPNVEPKPLALPFTVPVLAPESIDAWVARADSEHPLVRKTRVALESAKLDTSIAKAGHLPTVTVSGSYAKGTNSTTSEFLNSGSSSFSTPTTGTRVALTLNLPLFSGYSVQNSIQEKLLLEDKSLNDLEAARRSVAQATRQFYYGVRSGTAQVSALEAAESSSKLALDATKLGYKVGVRVNLDVLNAQAQVYTTQAQLSKARYDVLMAGLRLRQASGKLGSEDVSVVNGLLAR